MVLLFLWLSFFLFLKTSGRSQSAANSAEREMSVNLPPETNQPDPGKYQDLLMVAEAYLAKASAYSKNNDIRQSITYLDSCIELAVSHDLVKVKAEALHYLGVNYDNLSLYDRALEYFFRSLQCYERLDDQEGIADNFNSIGKIYGYTRNFENGLNYLHSALEVNNRLGNEKGKMGNYLNIGVIHQKRGDYEDALSFYENALQIAVALGDKEIEAVSIGNIGSTRMQQGQPMLGLSFLERALELKEENSDERRTLHTLNDIAETRLLLGDWKEARVAAGKVVGLAKDYEEGNQLRYAYLNLSRSYVQARDYEKAYVYLERFEEVKDSLFGIEKAQLIDALQIAYETEKKDQAIVSLRQEKELADSQRKVYLLVGMMVLMIMGGFYLHLHFNNKRNKALLEKEKEVDRLKANFFANISHEFRTPLTLILSPIDHLLASSQDSDERYQLGLMKKNGSRILRLVNQILELSKLESGQLKLSVRQLDVVPVLQGVTASFESLAVSKTIDLVFEAPAQPLILYFDPAQIETVLINLISNAVKFSGTGGKILVRVERVQPRRDHSGFLQIKVKDEGQGLSADKVRHIFDRFYQAGHADAAHFGGTGIGLALTKELVELHKGSISVESQLQVGTEVTVLLPMGKEHLGASQIAADEGIEGGQSLEPIDEVLLSDTVVETDLRMPIVLLIEDNEELRDYIRSIFQPTYRVIEAGDGEEGVAVAKEKIPDLVISDVMMPKMDGYEVCKQLKQAESTSHIPVILLTAKGSVASRIKGHENEADLYLSKPFVPKELLLCVHNLIRSRRQLRERYNKQVVLKPSDIAVNSVDEMFLERLLAVVEANFEDEGFSVEQLGKEMGMSRSQLHRKLHALTNESCSQFVRTFRLQRAMDLLKSRHASISEIAFKVGFGSPSYFNRCFLKHYGRTPSAVLESEVDV